MSRITRWFVTVGLYAVGFFLVGSLLNWTVSFFHLSKATGNVLVVVMFIFVFLGANFLVGMIQGYIKRKHSA